MLDTDYRRLFNDMKSFIPESRMATDPLRTLAYGTDASFYRLIPKIVVRADTEAEVSAILQRSAKQNIPVTFRAAGTSLSGQAISDSVLLVAGESWQQWEVLDSGRKIRLQPGIIGYSLNALVDYSDPFDIITHLMIGSEGTLAFISHIVYRTVASPPFKATALMMFPQIDGACQTAHRMQALPVAAAELMDRASLRSVEGKAGMPAIIRGVSPTTTALLVETQAADFATLSTHVQAIADALEKRVTLRTTDGGRTHEWQLAGTDLIFPTVFTDNAGQSDNLWKVRKGLLPSVGAVRGLGTTVLIMDDITSMVVDTYDGSLKAEHGTGRNMAPFVEKEWGGNAYGLMQKIKAVFDPGGLLNPGVILNPNPTVHLENLKPLPPADPLIDACMECGFCECHCPSRNLSLTPRQRIVIQREIARLTASGDDAARLAELKKGYDWQGEATCAADGLCGVACPVDVVTERVLRRAGYRVIYPEKMDGLCCGLPFESKGFFDPANRKSDDLEKALQAASDNGRLPVLCDTSPCLERMRRTFGPWLTLFEPVEFTATHLLNRLTITQTGDPVALHVTCSARKMGLDNAFTTVANACTETVVVPYGIECCGFAGDRGFNVPELNTAALSGLKSTVAGCTAGYANSRTCEIGLSHHSGIPYRSIMVLVDQCTK